MSVAGVIAGLRAAYVQPRYELDFATPVQLLVATILAAQSTDAGVNKVTRDLFVHLPDARAFADVDLGVLEDAIRPCGNAKPKAKWIQGACRILVERHGGEVPKDMDALVELPGVGRKTANVVLQTAYGMVTGVIVDTHVARVSKRLGIVTSEEPVEIERELMALVPRDTWTFFGPAMVLHGRRVCTAKKPACAGCGLASACKRVGVDA